MPTETLYIRSPDYTAYLIVDCYGEVGREDWGEVVNWVGADFELVALDECDNEIHNIKIDEKAGADLADKWDPDWHPSFEQPWY